MHQTVLVYANVHKHPEVDDVSHGTLQNHSFFQVLHFQHVAAQNGLRHFVTWVTCGLFQLGYNIFQCRFAYVKFLRKFAVVANCLGKTCKVSYVFGGNLQLFHKLFGGLVTFGVYAGAVKRVVAAVDSQKAGALLKGFCPQFVHFQQLTAVGKSAVLFTVGHNVFGNGGRNTRNVGEQRNGSGVKVDAHFVYAVFHNAVQRFAEFFLVHVVLVLSDANGFRVYFHQLSQWVLQTSCNAGCAALSHVEVGKFLRCKFACRVHRRPRFAYDNVLHGQNRFVKHVHDYLFAFT